MKFDLEITDTDLNDRHMIHAVYKHISEMTVNLSSKGKASLFQELSDLLVSAEELKVKWFCNQRNSITQRMLQILQEDNVDLVEGCLAE